MINFNEYTSNINYIETLNNIRKSLSFDYQNEVHLKYKGISFSIEPVNGKCCVFYNSKEYIYNDFDEVFLNFKFEEKTFIESMQNIEYE